MIVRSIVVQEPDPKCEACGGAIEELVSAVQAYAANGRDTFMSAYCKGCGSRITAKTHITRDPSATVMKPPSRTEQERLTGMRSRDPITP